MSQADNSNTTTATPPTIKSNKLTLLVKRFLDFMWYLIIGSLILMPIVTLVVGLNIPSDPQQRHTDVNFNLSFKVFPQQLDQIGNENSNRSELIQGRGEVKINNTHSSLAWYLSNAINEIMGIIALFGLINMRKVFAHLVEGDAFNQDIPVYIDKIGYVFIVWNIVYPVLVYFGGKAILSDIGQHAQSIQLTPMIQFNLIGLFTGLSILVLAGVMREAAKIHEEQSLTI